MKSCIGRLAAAAGMYRRRFRTQIVVTAFHRVNDVMPEDGLTCSSEKFESFCQFFKTHFSVVPFSQQVAGIRAGADMGGTLSITFDDGYLDNYQVAVPILRKYGLPATFFVATGFVGSSTVPFWDRDLPQPSPWMKWQHIRELADSGFEIGCHTVSHLDMGTSAPEAVRTELEQSRSMLEAQTGRRVGLFAYPFGGAEHISDTSRDAVRELGFDCCASCYGGTNSRSTNPYEIRRIGIAEWFSSPHQFGLEVMTGKA